jgi:hypothetical protein
MATGTLARLAPIASRPRATARIGATDRDLKPTPTGAPAILRTQIAIDPTLRARRSGIVTALPLVAGHGRRFSVLQSGQAAPCSVAVPLRGGNPAVVRMPIGIG